MIFLTNHVPNRCLISWPGWHQTRKQKEAQFPKTSIFAFVETWNLLGRDVVFITAKKKKNCDSGREPVTWLTFPRSPRAAFFQRDSSYGTARRARSLTRTTQHAYTRVQSQRGARGARAARRRREKKSHAKKPREPKCESLIRRDNTASRLLEVGGLHPEREPWEKRLKLHATVSVSSLFSSLGNSSDVSQTHFCALNIGHANSHELERYSAVWDAALLLKLML